MLTDDLATTSTNGVAVEEKNKDVIAETTTNGASMSENVTIVGEPSHLKKFPYLDLNRHPEMWCICCQPLSYAEHNK